VVRTVLRSDHPARQSRADHAATFITELPQAEHDAAEWQAAMETLLLVAERDGPEMLDRDDAGDQPASGEGDAAAKDAGEGSSFGAVTNKCQRPPTGLEGVGPFAGAAGGLEGSPQRLGLVSLLRSLTAERLR
jgi:hypothetical protein